MTSWGRGFLSSCLHVLFIPLQLRTLSVRPRWGTSAKVWPVTGELVRYSDLKQFYSSEEFNLMNPPCALPAGTTAPLTAYTATLKCGARSTTTWYSSLLLLSTSLAIFILFSLSLWIKSFLLWIFFSSNPVFVVLRFITGWSIITEVWWKSQGRTASLSLSKPRSTASSLSRTRNSPFSRFYLACYLSENTVEQWIIISLFIIYDLKLSWVQKLWT